ncbi:hypothetical protein A4H34_09900 [Peptidiphaga gingivicola]|uniref:Uncharacterized protein n=1 Tax=Peptidiphaga gingivicola TaxID=2741497 RepID=A0A179B105_9ACTO|nr:hypothetical protein [Peptidiphaga gingivicola]OAP85396.1 hypothetical protein A4H34_09900 [Peptidiphaga gingivicola]
MEGTPIVPRIPGSEGSLGPPSRLLLEASALGVGRVLPPPHRRSTAPGVHADTAGYRMRTLRADARRH